MLKTRKKWISLLVVLTFLLSLLPAGMGSAAAGSIRALTVPNVDDGKWQDVGDVVIEVDAGALNAGDSVTLRLPTDFKFVDSLESGKYAWGYNSTDEYVYVKDNTRDSTGEPVTTGGGYEVVKIYAPESFGGKSNGLSYDDISVSVLDKNEIQIKVKDEATPDIKEDAYILRVVIGRVWIKDGFSGDVELVADRPSTSGFPAGSVVIARVPGGLVELGVTNAPTFSDNTKDDPIRIRVKETTAGSLEQGSSTKYTLKLKLPSGFEWMGENVALTPLWGEEFADNGIGASLPSVGDSVYGKYFLKVESGIGDQELKLNLYKCDSTNGWIIAETSKATAFELKLNIQVADESKAKAGDVKVTVSGESDVSPSEIIVGTYGEYGATVEAKEVPEIKAGMLEQEIGDIKIKETVPGSLTVGRTIILTLPDGAKWTKVDENGDKDNGCELEFVGPVGDEGRSIKYRVKAPSSGTAAELTLEDFEVAVAPDFKGDLTVKIEGTANVGGTVTVAKVVSVVTASATSVPSVKIGLDNQVAGDLLIQETAAGAIKDDAYIVLDLPDGVSFSALPKVEVVEGDLTIDTTTIKRTKDGDWADNQLQFKISSESTKPSTIKISDIKLTANRMVPEGDIVVKVKGAAVAETADKDAVKKYFGFTAFPYTVQFNGKEAYTLYETDLFFPNSTSAAKSTIAKVVTPAPTETKVTAVFKVGETKYTVNGVEYTMDVAPYVKDGRTYLPVRYVAYALGVDPNNVYWNDETQTVILLKGGTSVQLTIGSKILKLNGNVDIPMDVAPELVNGRTMLPFRFVAQALGAQVEWDEATQTVTMNL